MAKKYIQKTLSVGLSLALCAGLIAPSFAATFTDLHEVLNGKKDVVYNENGDRSIEANNTDEGRVVKLYEDVVREDNEKSIVVHENKEDTKNILDLNGHNIDGSKGNGAVIVVGSETETNANLTIRDSKAHDEDGTYVAGSITGGHGSPDLTTAGHNKGQGLIVWGNATLESGKITGNSTAGTSGGSGAGVIVSGNFTMKGGEISGNTADGFGGGVDVNGAGHNLTVTGGVIKGNQAGKDGDDVSVRNGSGFTVTGGTFSDEDIKNYIAEGYTFVNNEDGTYTVVPENPVEPEPAPAPVVVVPTDPSLYVSDEPTVEIDDPTVPLAEGPVTRGEFVDYLWRHEGEPEVEVVGDHEYAPAISWAHSIEIIPDDGFDPDELVTVAFVRDILANFAVYSDVVMPELTTLRGDEDEAVLNCHEVLEEFYSESQAE
ncbi:MAG: hypothetical protein HDT38_04885 [Clostridiales bacterium]|nr:hypothetical protein [Clostridiales bacterium]